MHTDVHQHLWPAQFLAALRARRTPPRLVGWTLELPGERPYAIDPADHDADLRAARAAADGDELVCVAPSAGLGLDRLPAAEVEELAEAWLEGALELPAPFRAWAFPAGPGRAARCARPRRDRPRARRRPARRPRRARGRWRRCSTCSRRRSARCSSIPAPRGSPTSPATGPPGGRRSSRTSRSCTPRGGHGSARAASASRAAGLLRRRWPASGRCTASAGAPAAATRSPSTRSPSSRRRATARRRSTPSSACWASTSSATARTGRTRSRRCPGWAATRRCTALRVANPGRLFAHVPQEVTA